MSDSSTPIGEVPRAARAYGRAPLALLACVGVVSSVALSMIAQGWDRERTRAEFARSAESRAAWLKQDLDANLHELECLAAAYSTWPQISRSQFRSFVTPFLAQGPGIQALEWIPRVPASCRPDYEAAARKEGFPDFQITERRAQGRMAPAGPREEYFPVHFVEPYSGNEIALGFDLASDRVRRAALYRSRDSGRIAASARITLVQETSSQFGFLVFVPLYRKGAPVSSVADRRANLAGFVLGVFRIGDVLENALTRAKPEGIDVRVYDDSAPGSERLLGWHASRTRRALRPLAAQAPPGPKDLHYGATMDVAGRKWRVLFAPTPGYVAARRTGGPWMILAAGLLLTGSVSAYLSLVLTSAARARRYAAELLKSTQALEREVAERRRAEEALRRSERDFRTLIEVSNDAMIAVDENGLMTLFNPAAAHMSGWTAEEMLGQPIYLLVPPAAREAVREEMQRNLEASALGAPIMLMKEYPALRHSGEEFTVEVSSSVTWREGRPFVLMIGRDVTERKRMEQALEAKNRELESFVYTASHDLRSPLISMEGFTKLLADEYGERLDQQGHDYLRRVRANVAAMDSLLTDLLELSRVGRVEEAREAVAAAEVLSEVLADLSGTIGETGARVTVAENLPAVLYTRPRLFQVFSNLVSNAIKFARDGEAPRIEVGWQPLERGCRLWVKDNGIGIEPAHQRKVFEMFSRLRQKNVAGTGVGLAIVKRIVEDHGGEIGVDSSPGAGATFWFTVPALA